MKKLTSNWDKLLLTLNTKCFDHYTEVMLKNSYPVEYVSLYLTIHYSPLYATMIDIVIIVIIIVVFGQVRIIFKCNLYQGQVARQAFVP